MSQTQFQDFISQTYKTLIVTGYAIVFGECECRVPLRDCDRTKALRDALRRRANEDHIRFRTIVSNEERTFLAVRVDWSPDEEACRDIRELTGVHVCPEAHINGRFVYQSTPFCPLCGMRLG